MPSKKIIDLQIRAKNYKQYGLFFALSAFICLLLLFYFQFPIVGLIVLFILTLTAVLCLGYASGVYSALNYQILKNQPNSWLRNGAFAKSVHWKEDLGLTDEDFK
jgi:hypothetical protein